MQQQNVRTNSPKNIKFDVMHGHGGNTIHLQKVRSDNRWNNQTTFVSSSVYNFVLVIQQNLMLIIIGLVILLHVH
jgi:hypothetical protein